MSGIPEQCIVVFGPGPKYKGGLSNYTTSLARALNRFSGVNVHIVSWTQQYPAIIPRDFIDRSSKSSLLGETRINVHYLTDYNNPFSWNLTWRKIAKLNPDIILFQWSISIQGLPMGYIARKLGKHTKAEIIFDLHFVVQKEKSNIDRIFTRYGISCANTYVVHAYKTAKELEKLFPETHFTVNESGERQHDGSRTVIKLYHPVYDMFSPNPAFDKEALRDKLRLKKHVFLFFGFIRKYKGLHNVIRAFAKAKQKRDDISLLIVGESFWQTLDSKKLSTQVKKVLFGIAKMLLLNKTDDEQNYRPLELIGELGISDSVTVINDYVPNEEVYKYFQVSDTVVLFYEYATPSGIESMAYNFNLPILATRVGHFHETVKEGYNGYLAEPGNVDSMAAAMLRSVENPIPKENVARTADTMSWANYAAKILGK